MTRPTATAVRIPNVILCVTFMTYPARTALELITVATDKSIPPVSRTIVSPIAAIITTAFPAMIVCALLDVIKCGETTVNASISTSMIKTAGYLFEKFDGYNFDS